MAMTRLWASTAWALLSGLAGCAHETITPVPGVLPSAGMLLETQRVRLTPNLELRRYKLLKSDVGNVAYPLNVQRAKFADRLVAKLFVRRGENWHFLDFADMPRARSYLAPNLSPAGTRIVYERPVVDSTEGPWPRAYPRDRRGRCVVIRHLETDLQFQLQQYTDVYGLGLASHWRPDGQQVAFTTDCARAGRAGGTDRWQLVVLDATGQVVLDAERLKGLAGLEFIAYSPDGKRIAALKPTEPRAAGRRGGKLVELDLTARKLRTVAEVPALLACKYVGRFEKLVAWDAQGRCRLAKPEQRRSLTTRPAGGP